MANSEYHTDETATIEAAALKNEKRAKKELAKTVASIGGDVTVVEIDNSKGKLPSEAEERLKAGIESAKKQQAKAEKEAQALEKADVAEETEEEETK